MNAEVVLVQSQNLLFIGTCFIHEVHNSFFKGLKEFGQDAADFVVSLHNFTHCYANREQDLTKVQDQLGSPNLKIPVHESALAHIEILFRSCD